VTAAILLKLVAIVITVALGWLAGRLRWLGPGLQPDGSGSDPSRVLGNAAFYIFVPALLFRTTARMDFSTMPWGLLAAFFVPALAYIGVLYGWQRWRAHQQGLGPAAPAARLVTAGYGNAVQLGIPMSLAFFGEPGLALHLALVSLHGLVLLSLLTLLAETELARAHAQHGASTRQVLATTLRNTLIHPVMLPILCGMAYRATGLPLPELLDEVLKLLGTAVVPLCLVLIGLSLAYQGSREALRSALPLVGLKLFVLPALVLAVAHWGFGLAGVPLGVVVVMAALPSGNNALIFAQRYQVLEAEASAAIVISTATFAATASMWLAVLAWVAPR
jgi:predicted permease